MFMISCNDKLSIISPNLSAEYLIGAVRGGGGKQAFCSHSIIKRAKV